MYTVSWYVSENEETIKQISVGKFQILSSRRLLANLKYYQADVCWQILNTIRGGSTVGDAGDASPSTSNICCFGQTTLMAHHKTCGSENAIHVLRHGDDNVS